MEIRTSSNFDPVRISSTEGVIYEERVQKRRRNQIKLQSKEINRTYEMVRTCNLCKVAFVDPFKISSHTKEMDYLMSESVSSKTTKEKA